MSDLSRLTEAMKFLAGGSWVERVSLRTIDAVAELDAAARLVVDGQDEERCITHNSTGRGPSPIGEACHYAALRLCSGFTHPPVKPCKWVAARLTFPKQGAET